MTLLPFLVVHSNPAPHYTALVTTFHMENRHEADFFTPLTTHWFYVIVEYYEGSLMTRTQLHATDCERDWTTATDLFKRWVGVALEVNALKNPGSPGASPQARQ